MTCGNDDACAVGVSVMQGESCAAAGITTTTSDVEIVTTSPPETTTVGNAVFDDIRDKVSLFKALSDLYLGLIIGGAILYLVKQKKHAHDNNKINYNNNNNNNQSINDYFQPCEFLTFCDIFQKL